MRSLNSSPARGGRIYSQNFRDDGFYNIGDVIEVLNDRNQTWTSCKVSRVNSDGTIDVVFDDGYDQRNVDYSRTRGQSQGQQLFSNGNGFFPKFQNGGSDQLREGTRIEARPRNGSKWFPGVISKVRPNGTFNVNFDDGETEIGVGFENIRNMNNGKGNSFDTDNASSYGYSWGNNVRRLAFQEGMLIEAKYSAHGKFYPGRISRVNTNGTYDIAFHYGETVTSIKADYIRPLTQQQFSGSLSYNNNGADFLSKGFGKKFGFGIGSVVEFPSSRFPGTWVTGRVTQYNAATGLFDAEVSNGSVETNILERNAKIVSESDYGRSMLSVNVESGSGFSYAMNKIRGGAGFNGGGYAMDSNDFNVRPGMFNYPRDSRGYFNNPEAYGNSYGYGNGFPQQFWQRFLGPTPYNNVPYGLTCYGGERQWWPYNAAAPCSFPTETGFGVLHTREIVRDQWRPMLPYVFDAWGEHVARHGVRTGYGSFFNSPGCLPEGLDVVVVPGSEWCEFTSSGNVCVGRIQWNGWRSGCPLFVRCRAGAPKYVTAKVVFYALSVMVAEVTIDFYVRDSSADTSIGPRSTINRLSSFDGRRMADSYSIADEGSYYDCCDRRSPMFRSVFLILPDGDETAERIFEDCAMTLPGLTLRRRDGRGRISESYLRSADAIQVLVSSKDTANGNGGRTYEAYSDLRAVQTILLTAEDRSRRITISCAELPMIPPQEVDRVSENNLSYCPEFAVWKWVQQQPQFQTQNKGQIFDARYRLLEASRAITKLFLNERYSPLPLGMLIVPSSMNFNGNINGGSFGNNDNYGSSANNLSNNYNGGGNASGAFWNLIFLCDDFASAIQRPDLSIRPVQVRQDVKLVQDAYPLLKATVALLMCYRLISKDMLPFQCFPVPFDAFATSKQFDETALIDLANLYDDMSSDSRAQMMGSNRGVQQQQFVGGTTNFSFLGAAPGSPSRASPMDVRGADRDGYGNGYGFGNNGPYGQLQRGGDFLQAALQCCDSALSSLQMWGGLSRAAKKSRMRLDDLVPSWQQQCDMHAVEVDLRVWWVSGEAYEQRWKYIQSMAGTHNALPPAQLAASFMNGGGTFTDMNMNVSSLFPRRAQSEIYGRLISELGLKDTATAQDIAFRLAQEGCESWEDVLRLDEFVGDQSNGGEALKRFLFGIGLPMVHACKLLDFIRRTRGII